MKNTTSRGTTISSLTSISTCLTARKRAFNSPKTGSLPGRLAVPTRFSTQCHAALKRLRATMVIATTVFDPGLLLGDQALNKLESLRSCGSERSRPAALEIILQVFSCP